MDIHIHFHNGKIGTHEGPFEIAYTPGYIKLCKTDHRPLTIIPFTSVRYFSIVGDDEAPKPVEPPPPDPFVGATSVGYPLRNFGAVTSPVMAAYGPPDLDGFGN